MTELLQSLIEIDRMVTLSINGSDSLFLDSVAGIFTSIYIWIPLALAAIFLILRNIIPQRLILVLFMVVLTVLICDQVSSSFCKPFFHRLRPTHDPHLINMIDTVMVIVEDFMVFFQDMPPILSVWRRYSCGWYVTRGLTFLLVYGQR